MSRKKSSSTVKLKSEEFPLDKYIKLKFKKFELTEKQKDFLSLAFDPDIKIIFINGPAGSAKTFSAMYAALHLFNMDQEKEIIYVRTAAESAEKSLGSLPGAVEEKFEPFGGPLYDKLEEILNKETAKELLEKQIVKLIPINYTRGSDWKNKIIIADEAQNYTTKELTTLLTRISENTKYFICGDLMQSDIKSKSGLGKISNLFDTEFSLSHGICVFEFTKEDILRSEILKHIVSVLEKLN